MLSLSPKPGRSIAITLKLLASWSLNSSHIFRFSGKPCSSTTALPLPLSEKRTLAPRKVVYLIMPRISNIEQGILNFQVYYNNRYLLQHWTFRIRYSLFIHEFFNFFRLNGYVSHKIYITFVGYKYIVFNTYSQFFFRYVNAGLTGKHHSGFHRYLEKAYIMHIQS